VSRRAGLCRRDLARWLEPNIVTYRGSVPAVPLTPRIGRPEDYERKWPKLAAVAVSAILVLLAWAIVLAPLWIFLR
jgi:hypothetical protein